MSIIGKKPFVNEILDSLTEAQLGTLSSLVDNLGSAVLVSLYGNNIISDDNKGVSHVTFRLEQISNLVVDGILCYKDDSHCGLFVFNDSTGEMDSYKIYPSTLKYSPIYEHLSVEEFRRCIDDELESAPGGKDAWVEKMKEVMDYDSVENQVEVGTHLYVDGKIEIGDTGGSAGDLVVGHEIVIDKISNIVDTDGNSIMPDSEPNKIPVGGSGFVYQLETIAQILNAPATGHYRLESVNGVLDWVEVV